MPRVLISEGSREQLILEIQKYPCIWNHEYDTYNLKDARDRAWACVARALECRVEECKCQWKYLKEKFRREDARDRNLKASGAKITSQWRFLEILSFIRPFVKPKSDKPSENPYMADTVEVLTDSFGPNNSTTITTPNNHTDQLPEVADSYPSLVMPFSEPQSHDSLSLCSIMRNFPSNIGKRKYPDPLQITNVSSESNMDMKKRKQEVDLTSQATYSFYRSMGDEALKLPTLERLKLQVAVIQLHIQALEKHKANEKITNKDETSEEKPEKEEPEVEDALEKSVE